VSRSDPAERALLDLSPALDVKPGLERIRRLLGRLGDPHRSYRSIHIAGTNGKGSVAAILDAVLRAAGFRVGCYTSPHLVELRERIRVNGRCIPVDALRTALSALAPAIEAMADRPSVFELLTAVALAHFAATDVDVAVVEAGMGGRFDATNVIAPSVSVLTTVDVDHTDFLGATRAEIAWEKAGIAKDAVPLLLGRTIQGEVADLIEREAGRRHASVIRSPVSLEAIAADRHGTRLRVAGLGALRRLRLPLAGPFQEENLHTALGTIACLRDRGWSIADEPLRAGVAAVRWPGRLEFLGDGPVVLLDAAHNVAGVSALLTALERLWPDRGTRRLLFGALRDKDVEGMAARLAPAFPRITAVASAAPRALPARSVLEVLERLGARPRLADTVADGLREALAMSAPGELLVVTGSMTVVGEARMQLVGGPCDEPER
jgi:dihydrofolate synthase/folylpolyglutamate synthase